MTTRHLRAALLLVAALPAAVSVAAAVLKASHLKLSADRHRIELTPQPWPDCPHCYGDGGWWVGGAFPEMEACGCWSHRRELIIPLRPVAPWPDDPSF
ncbi:hypothetical protein ACODT5_03505 [Streptomyces sp. 5.8]|uniref:hypothetical protein n=1 Tax=Streptomyces sp. 5.8 TaxID=3406571 RepID=UPI003BB7E864